MTPERILLDKIEFYITNVCNLSCERCNRFNNYAFRGYQDWADYKDVYSQWAQRVDFDKITILGGEPLLNPTVIDWACGIHQLWNKPVQILTNGTRLSRVRGLYDILSDKSILIWIGVSWHVRDDITELESEIKKFLVGPLTKLDKFDEDNTFGADIVYVDCNNVRIPVWFQDYFHEISLHTTPQGRFTLRQSDPLAAHEKCGFAIHKNYHFIKGRLYKCGPVALFPEFDDQHDLDLCDDDKQLIRAYHPLAVEDFDQIGADFLSKINQVIPQCKFCPTEYNPRRIIAIRKNSTPAE